MPFLLPFCSLALALAASLSPGEPAHRAARPRTKAVAARPAKTAWRGTPHEILSAIGVAGVAVGLLRRGRSR